MNSTERLFPMNKPDGFVPSVQRYSADHPSGTKSVTVMYLGVQSSKSNHPAFHDFRQRSEQLAGLDVGPVFHDFSQFTDPQGNATQIMVAYWYDQAAYTSWSEARAVATWWQDELSDNTDVGYFREVFTASINNTETIAFKEFVTGLSACPRNTVKPMGESGYWGAARDRIPASADSLHETQHPEPLQIKADRKTKGQRIVVTPPKNLTLIRSGVSWQDCGPEQLDSYLSNLKPVLDEGMEYLRQNPVDTGCCCMRQVDTITIDNQATKENYCAGYFLSFGHLESWAHKHPTHLAIYGRAQKERVKYKENLELRTYHEVYIIDGDASFEYVNCHKQTGLLPYF